MIIICVPYYKVDREVFRKSVQSLLKQSYPGEYEILIVSDGCKPTAQEVLGIKRDNLKFFNMKKNRGRYFIDAVVSSVSPHEFYMPSDADDVSSYDRLYFLMKKQLENDADAVFHYQTVEKRTGKVIHETYPLIKSPQDAVMRHIAHFSGLYKTDAVRRAGGFHGDFRVGYDTLFVNLVKMTGKIDVTPRLLYTRTHQPDSLTNNKKTGFGSEHRRMAVVELYKLYKKCYKHQDKIPEIIQDSMKPETRQAIEIEGKRLKKEMGW